MEDSAAVYGTVINLNGDTGAWFDMDGGGRVKLRTMTRDAKRAMEKQTTKVRVEYKRVEGKAERFEVPEVDDEVESLLFWDHVIMDWEHLLDGKRQPIPCTRENKVLLMSTSLKFARFVAESLETLGQDAAKRLEALEKN